MREHINTNYRKLVTHYRTPRQTLESTRTVYTTRKGSIEHPVENLTISKRKLVANLSQAYKHIGNM